MKARGPAWVQMQAKCESNQVVQKWMNACGQNRGRSTKRGVAKAHVELDWSALHDMSG